MFEFQKPTVSYTNHSTFHRSDTLQEHARTWRKNSCSKLRCQEIKFYFWKQTAHQRLSRLTQTRTRSWLRQPVNSLISFVKAHFHQWFLSCVVTQNIHTHPKDGHWRGRGSQWPNFLRESMKLKLSLGKVWILFGNRPCNTKQLLSHRGRHFRILCLIQKTVLMSCLLRSCWTTCMNRFSQLHWLIYPWLI